MPDPTHDNENTPPEEYEPPPVTPMPEPDPDPGPSLPDLPPSSPPGVGREYPPDPPMPEE